MDRFRYAAFLAEFPFLKSLVGDRTIADCDSITIKRIDEKLLDHVPDFSGATGSLVDIADAEVVSFILKKDVTLSSAVRCSGAVTHNEAHRDEEYWQGETILEAIDRHGCGKDIRFIVSVRYGYHIRDHCSLNNWKAIIYKPARNTNIMDYIDAAHTHALQQVKAEVAF